MRYAQSLPEGTFGRSYGEFMRHRKFLASDRPPVRFIDDEELAYVAQRSREVHDLWHVLFNCKTTVLGELALKAVEFVQVCLCFADKYAPQNHMHASICCSIIRSPSSNSVRCAHDVMYGMLCEAALDLPCSHDAVLQTGMPMTALSVVGASWRLKAQDRSRLINELLPWAVHAGSRSADLMCLYYEKHFEVSRTAPLCS